MTVSATASKIYQTAKSAAKGVWLWRMEWSKAMQKAWRKIMSKTTAKKAQVTKEIWNSAASLHVRGQAGLMTLVNRTAAKIDSTDFVIIANHLYNDFTAKKDRPGAAGNFGLYLNLMHK